MAAMLVTLAATASPGTLDDATDLGFLLHKHPDRAQVFDLPVGRAHVFYPEATAERCEVALLLEVDPVGIVRNKRFGGGDDDARRLFPLARSEGQRVGHRHRDRENRDPAGDGGGPARDGGAAAGRRAGAGPIKTALEAHPSGSGSQEARADHENFRADHEH